MRPQVLDLNNNLIAVLDKAHKIGYTKIKNNLWTCQFTMPLHDKKNIHVKPKYHIELYDHDKRIGRFIVNPKNTVKNASTNEITYQCEHVLSLLHSDVLFGYHQWSNYTTKTVLTDLMQAQEVKHWKIGTVAFTRYFHYGWENEDSLLNAIMSVPKPFDKPYMWTWDDSAYPFTLNLVEPSYTPVDVIASGHNLKGIVIDEDPTNIVTRIYPLGFGEGINQLNIRKINNGLPYLQNNAAIAEYGLHKRIWADLRFENVESLKASGQALLDKFSKPLRSMAIDCRDYTLYERERKKKLMALYDVGDVLLVHDQDTNTNEEIRVEKIVKSDLYGAPQDIQLELGNVFGDISGTFTELQKKSLTNEVHSNGSTTAFSFNYQDNCDGQIPAVIPFYIDDDVLNVNTVELTFRTKNFRAYSQATKGGGALVKSTGGGGGTVKSTSSGGGTTATSSSGGGVAKSTGSGGGTTQSSSAGGDHYHDIALRMGGGTVEGTPSIWQSLGVAFEMTTSGTGGFKTWGGSGDHAHNTVFPNHSHNFDVPNHNHSLTIQNHAHEIDIPNHAHEIDIPEHQHEVEHKITELSAMPSGVVIKVGNNVVPHTAINGDRINLANYIPKDSSGRIVRGRHEVTILPNGLARIEADLILRVFLQSRLGEVL